MTKQELGHDGNTSCPPPIERHDHDVSWKCPFCQEFTNLRDTDRSAWDLPINAGIGHHQFLVLAVYCRNDRCKRFTLSCKLNKTVLKERRRPIPGNAPRIEHDKVTETVAEWHLVPDSIAKPMPAYLPKAVIEDYEEACRIQTLSPKAAATLARRCLQGMIWNFFGVSKPTLKQEIDAIADRVDLATWQAIDAVRAVGNIGEHMEKDIDLIIEVDPNEVGLLIGLIELLIEEWYIACHDREERVKAVTALAAGKRLEKEGAKNPAPENSATSDDAASPAT